MFEGWLMRGFWATLRWSSMVVHWFRLGYTGLSSSEEDLAIPAKTQK